MPNLFTRDSVCELGVTFLSGGRKFSYDLHFDVEKEEFLPSENISQEQQQKGGNLTGIIIAGVCLTALIGYALISLFRHRKIEIK